MDNSTHQTSPSIWPLWSINFTLALVMSVCTYLLIRQVVTPKWLGHLLAITTGLVAWSGPMCMFSATRLQKTTWAMRIYWLGAILTLLSTVWLICWWWMNT